MGDAPRQGPDHPAISQDRGPGSVGTLGERPDKGAANRPAVIKPWPNTPVVFPSCNAVHDHSATGSPYRQTRAIGRPPGLLHRWLPTWDQGTEMARHAKFIMDTADTSFFCDPHNPRQRGNNENTSDLLRQHHPPKDTEPSTHTRLNPNSIAFLLNNHPRKTLGAAKQKETLGTLDKPPAEAGETLTSRHHQVKYFIKVETLKNFEYLPAHH